MQEDSNQAVRAGGGERGARTSKWMNRKRRRRGYGKNEEEDLFQAAMGRKC